MQKSYIELQDLMLEALNIVWEDFGNVEKPGQHPENHLSSRSYWAWLCAQYFSRTAYLIGVDRANCELLKEEIMSVV
jgi:hypothetical protein